MSEPSAMPTGANKRVPFKKQIDVLRDEIASLTAGREELLEALLDVVNQACQVEYRHEERKCIVRPHGSAECDAVDLLERLGHAMALGGGRYDLVWPERKGE